MGSSINFTVSLVNHTAFILCQKLRDETQTVRFYIITVRYYINHLVITA